VERISIVLLHSALS